MLTHTGDLCDHTSHVYGHAVRDEGSTDSERTPRQFWQQQMINPDSHHLPGAISFWATVWHFVMSFTQVPFMFK